MSSTTEGPAELSDDKNAQKITRAQQRDRSVALILKTAIGLFAERGFTGVSLDEIALEAGLKRSLLLYYYKSKDELWRAAATQVSLAFNASLVRNASAIVHRGDRASLEAGLAASLRAFLEEPDFPRFLVREGGVESDRLHWLVEHFNYVKIDYGSVALRKALGTSIMRDALFAVMLSMSALGPLMEASLSQASGRKRSGVFPMTRSNQKKLASLLARLILLAEA